MSKHQRLPPGALRTPMITSVGRHQTTDGGRRAYQLYSRQSSFMPRSVRTARRSAPGVLACRHRKRAYSILSGPTFEDQNSDSRPFRCSLRSLPPLPAVRTSYTFIRDPYALTEDPYAFVRDPYTLTRDPYKPTRDPYKPTRGPYIFTGHPYAFIRKPYTRMGCPRKTAR